VSASSGIAVAFLWVVAPMIVGACMAPERTQTVFDSEGGTGGDTDAGGTGGTGDEAGDDANGMGGAAGGSGTNGGAGSAGVAGCSCNASVFTGWQPCRACIQSLCCKACNVCAQNSDCVNFVACIGQNFGQAYCESQYPNGLAGADAIIGTTGCVPTTCAGNGC